MSRERKSTLRRERRDNLLNYSKTTTAKPVVNYKIIRVKGRKKALRKKHILGHILRFTRKMRSLLPMFKIAGSRREDRYGSLEYLPGSSNGLFLFTKKVLPLTHRRVFAITTGYFTPLTLNADSSEHLYILSHLDQAYHAIFNLTQSAYFKTFLFQWDLLNQLSWIDFNHVIAPAKSRRLFLRHPRLIAKPRLFSLPKPRVKKVKIKKKVVVKGKKRVRHFLPPFTVREKRRASKLFQRFSRSVRATRLKLKVLARAANVVNLAGRSRTLSYLKNALKFQKKRKFLGYEIEHSEVFERDLIVVNYRYKAYSAFECFYNNRRDFRRLHSLSDSTNIYRNDDRFENSFTR